MRMASGVKRAEVAKLMPRHVGARTGGQSQRARFAVALLGDPQELLLDEPTVGMNIGARRAFWEQMREVAASGRTVVFAKDLLMARGAKRVLTAVLLEKPGKRAVTIDADFVGFTCPDVFVVGYGMDAAHAFRQLPFVGVVDYGDGDPDLFDA